MDRRVLLQRIAVVLGTAASASLSRAVLAGAGAVASPGKPVFNSNQTAMVSTLAELIIPTTDTPGAIAAGVPQFIESIVSQWYREDERRQFFQGLEAIDGYCQQQFQRAFGACDGEQQRAALEWAESEHDFFFVIRELTVVGYFSSEIGATQALAYNPMTMVYDGAYPLAKVGRQWSW